MCSVILILYKNSRNSIYKYLFKKVFIQYLSFDLYFEVDFSYVYNFERTPFFIVSCFLKYCFR